MKQLLLPVLAFSSEDFNQAERLLDLIALQRDKKPSGYILLVAAPDTHPEQHERMKIAAQIGFEHFGLLTVGWPAPKKAVPGQGTPLPPTKYELVNHVFQTAAAHIASHYKDPFVWLEPDSVTVSRNWLEVLSEGYQQQPKRYMGARMKHADGTKILNRVAVYPQNCALDLRIFLEGGAPFELAARDNLVNRSSKTPLIQPLQITMPEDAAQVRPDAVLVHGDKQGILLEMTMQKVETGPNNLFDSPLCQIPPGDMQNPIPSYMVPEEIFKTSTSTAPEKVDGRTKAGRLAKAAVTA